MKRVFEAGLAISVFALVLALGSAVNAQAPAQGQQPPPPPQNLQVLPKDIARPELITMMRGFTQALGVECSYCHVAEGRGGRNDYAADEKAPKKTARVMIQMVAHVNDTLATGIGKPAADVTKVQCGTCHRGSAIPPKFDPPPAPAPAAPARPPAQ